MYLSDKHIKKLKHYFSSKPIKRAYLFGSYSRREANERSDVDILVEYKVRLKHTHFRLRSSVPPERTPRMILSGGHRSKTYSNRNIL